MDKNKKSVPVAGIYMSEQPDHTTISLISTIIKDGVKNFKELARKFAACKKISFEDAQKIIADMNKEGKVGYYYTKYNAHCEAAYYFMRWDPKEKVFPETPVYKSGKYFNSLFRD